MQGDDNKRRKNRREGERVISDPNADNVGKPERESSPDADEEIIFVPNNPLTWSVSSFM